MNNYIDKIIRRLPDEKFANIAISFCVGIYYTITDVIKYHLFRKKPTQLITNNPLISVYIPTYNRCDLLIERALKSVLEQSYKNLEIIISDDGSNDATFEKIVAINDPRIKYICSSRKDYRYPNIGIYHWFCGPVVASNNALKNVTGDWIARIDDDDVWTPDHLEVLLKFALEGDYEFVSSDYLRIDCEGAKVISILDDKNNVTNIGGTQTWLYRSFLKNFRYNIHCWRKRHNRVNDTDLQQRIYNAGVKIGYLNLVTAIVESRPGENFVGSKAYLENSLYYQNMYG